MPDSDFKMPSVNLGDVVLWTHNRSSVEPAAAIVTQVGLNAIKVLIFPPESKVGIPRDGVRHISDPALSKVVSDSGVWDYTASARSANAMREHSGMFGDRKAAK